MIVMYFLLVWSRFSMKKACALRTAGYVSIRSGYVYGSNSETVHLMWVMIQVEVGMFSNIN